MCAFQFYNFLEQVARYDMT